MKNRIAFASMMGAITTGVISFVLILLHVGPGVSFLTVWMKSWGLAYLIVIPVILVVGPRLQRFVDRVFGPPA
jgi:hypothetical protein